MVILIHITTFLKHLFYIMIALSGNLKFNCNLFNDKGQARRDINQSIY